MQQGWSESCLFGQDIIGKYSHAGPVGDEVSDRLHDIPWVDPPREPGQGSALHRQEGHAGPDGFGSMELSCLGQLCLHLKGQESKEVWIYHPWDN